MCGSSYFWFLDAGVPLCFSFYFFFFSSSHGSFSLLHPLSIHACGQQRARLNPRRRRCDRELVAAFQISSFLSPPFLCISTLVAVGEEEEGEREKRGGGREEGGKGVNQPPTSISNSLCSPHASRGSDLTLARRKKQILYNVSQRDGASGLMSRLGCKHPARAVEESRRRSRGVKLLLPPRGTLRKWPKTVLLSHYFVTFSLL